MKKSVLGLFIIFSIMILSFNVFALTCEETGGVICVGEEICSVGFEPSDDSELCCLDECFIEGDVVPFDYGSITCEELGGEICSENKLCSVGFTSSSDSELCCLDDCITGEEETTPFDYGSVTCEELGGTICSSGGCSVGFVKSSDSELCCLDDCVAKDGSPVGNSNLDENDSGEETVSIKSAYYIIAGVVAIILIILIINYFRLKRGVVYEADTSTNPIENKKL